MLYPNEKRAICFVHETRLVTLLFFYFENCIPSDHLNVNEIERVLINRSPIKVEIFYSRINDGVMLLAIWCQSGVRLQEWGCPSNGHVQSCAFWFCNL
jgi:hypothetical protein